MGIFQRSVSQGKQAQEKRALVIHHIRPVFDDAASTALIRAGYTLDRRFPIEGDPLPGPDEGHDIALMHGSLADVTRPGDPGMAEEHRWIEQWWRSGKPYFGICHGFQLACMHLGGRVGPPEHAQAEFGYYPLRSSAPDLVPDGLHVFQWHYYGADLPAGCARIAGSELYPNQVVRFGPGRLGVQFHAEMSLKGQRYLRETVPDWQMRPGAQTNEQQEELAKRYLRPMTKWLGDFMKRWLDECAGMANR